uniref:Uncharacterized protein n=1 Tax=Anguilla anguilla TaxID=7936 RepID=A0A0E9PF39_ANGAN
MLCLLRMLVLIHCHHYHLKRGQKSADYIH